MKLFPRARRRRAGIYLVRTDRHFRRGRENGYTGRSNYVDLRMLCHHGTCRHKNHKAKDWTDLNPRWHVLRLPWWLSFKPIQAALEALAIAVTLPRYNVQLNRKNPRRVPLAAQRLQRAARDSRPWGYRAARQAANAGTWVIRLAGVLCLLAGAWTFAR